MKWEIKDISDEAYFSIGDISKEMSPVDSHDKLVVSNSFIKKVFKTNLRHELIFGDNEVDEDLQEIFDIGSGFHAYILENDEFGERYHISDAVDASRETTRISKQDFEFIKASHKNVEIAYPNMLDGLNVELAIFGELNGVRFKCKIDKLNIEQSSGKFTHVEIVDLKSTYFSAFGLKKDHNGERRKLRYMLSDVGYDLQFYIYQTMVEHWLESINQHCTVSFALLTASKETFEVQKFRLSSKMYDSGKAKFDSCFGDIQSFVRDGKDRLNDEEVL